MCFSGGVVFLRTPAAIKLLAYSGGVGAVFALAALAPASYLPDGSAIWGVRGHNANFTAYVVAASGYIIVAALMFLKTEILERAVLIALLVTIAVALFLLGSRGAQLSLLLMLAAAVFGRIAPHWARMAGVFLLLGSAAVISSGLLFGFLPSIDVVGGKSTGDFSGRLQIWAEALAQISRQPLFGIGPETFAVESTLKVPVHNMFLSILVGYGAIGLAAFGAAALVFGRHILKSEHGSRLLLLLVCFLMPILIGGQVENIAFLWLAVAVSLSIASAASDHR